MNYKLKCLMAVSAISFGLSAVNASAGLPENPEDQSTQGSLPAQSMQVTSGSSDTNYHYSNLPAGTMYAFTSVYRGPSASRATELDNFLRTGRR